MENALEAFIHAGEGQQSEFLLNTEHSHEIAAILCAFANTEGGSLFVGIKKNGKIIGTEPSESYSTLMYIAENLCRPVIPFEITVHQSTYKFVVEINIGASTNIHSSQDKDENWNTYIRKGTSIFKINSVLKKFLEIVKHKLPAETEISTEMNELLAHLETNQLSLTKLVKLTKIKREQLDYLLAQLIYSGTINYTFREDTIFFSKAF